MAKLACYVAEVRAHANVGDLVRELEARRNVAETIGLGQKWRNLRDKLQALSIEE